MHMFHDALVSFAERQVIYMTENIENNGCSQRDSAEHEGYVKASRSFNRIWKERDSAQLKLLEKIRHTGQLWTSILTIRASNWRSDWSRIISNTHPGSCSKNILKEWKQKAIGRCQAETNVLPLYEGFTDMQLNAILSSCPAIRKWHWFL